MEARTCVVAVLSEWGTNLERHQPLRCWCQLTVMITCATEFLTLPNPIVGAMGEI